MAGMAAFFCGTITCNWLSVRTVLGVCFASNAVCNVAEHAWRRYLLYSTFPVLQQ
jgi:hypothetical protein